jgi:hypothetical protein
MKFVVNDNVVEKIELTKFHSSTLSHFCCPYVGDLSRLLTGFFIDFFLINFSLCITVSGVIKI